MISDSMNRIAPIESEVLIILSMKNMYNIHMEIRKSSNNNKYLYQAK